MSQYHTERIVEIPEGVEITSEPLTHGKKIFVKGPKGTLEREFDRLRVQIHIEDEKVRIENYFADKSAISMAGTIAGHIKNMIKGVTKGFKYTVRIITSHFPVTCEIQNDVILVKNLYGRRDPIRVPRIEGVDLKIREEEYIDVTGIDIEKVSQQSARLAESSRLRGKKAKDPTRFQDGLYVVES
jgi:large subunit ribosomal protein L6